MNAQPSRNDRTTRLQKHGQAVMEYQDRNGARTKLCLACAAQLNLHPREGTPQPGNTACEWCGKGRVKRR